MKSRSEAPLAPSYLKNASKHPLGASKFALSRSRSPLFHGLFSLTPAAFLIEIVSWLIAS